MFVYEYMYMFIYEYVYIQNIVLFMWFYDSIDKI